MTYIFLLLLISPIVLANNNLYDYLDNAPVDGIPECQRHRVMTCHRIKVNMDVIDSKKDVFIPEIGTVLQRQLEEDEDGKQVVEYSNAFGDEITLEMEDGKIAGDMQIGDRFFEIVGLNETIQALMEINVSDLPPEDDDQEEDDEDLADREFSPKERTLLLRGQLDRQTIAYVSVKVYYTPEAPSRVSNLLGKINLAIVLTNIGYYYSGIAVRLTLHCTERSTIHDQAEMRPVLTQFKNSKSSYAAVRGGADIAVLLTSRGDLCGIAYVNAFRRGNTFGVVHTNCAFGYYTFGHEIGHMFGARHDRDQYENDSQSAYHYGWLIKKSDGSASGYRTNMAYSASGHRTKVNRYSSSSRWYNGYRTGNSKNDNARTHNDNRWLMAAVDDERPGCGGGNTITSG